MQPGLVRDQALLFGRSLDDAVADGDLVRDVDELLRAQDGAVWETRYDAIAEGRGLRADCYAGEPCRPG
jgi:hypothetical protein